jgi:positive phototaxis protein PixI
MVTPSALTVATQTPQKVLGDAYLKFDLGAGTAALMPMKSIQEVVSLAASRLTPMPNRPACVLGLMHRRNRVLWVVDLAQLLGVGSLAGKPRQYDLILLRSGANAWAGAVQRVQGMTWLPPDQLQLPPSYTPANLLNYLHGCVYQAQEISLVLDIAAILQSPILHVP